MRNIFWTLILILLTSQLQADWSGFAHITPRTEAKAGINVLINPIKNKLNKYSIKVNTIGYNQQYAWLIITKNKLTADKQQLREYIWNGATESEQNIILKTRLFPVGIAGFREKIEVEKFYLIELDSDLIKRSYIYIDYPSMILDGGYYYSIDLAKYYDKLVEKKVNKYEERNNLP